MTLASRLLACAVLIATTLVAQRPDDRRGTKVVASQSIHCGGALLQIDFGQGSFDLPNSRIVQRVQDAANAVASFYGVFPVPRTRILVIPVAGRHGVLQGTTWGDQDGFSASLRIRIGSATTTQELADDWILTHELVHTALASLPDDQSWLEEGLASYVEPFIRMEAEEISQQTMWAGMIRGMPNGEPEAEDKGMNNTHTWGRTYWGGALFCLEADVRIRQATGNRMGLPDALRGIVAAGATIDREMPPEKVLAIGDAAIKTHILEEMYEKWSVTPVTVDLPALWSRLGLQPDGSTVVLDSKAPLAQVREAMSIRGSSVK